MEIILYSPVIDGIEKKLWHRLEEFSPESGLELHRSIKGLERRLRQPRQCIGAILAYIPDRPSLAKFLPLKDLLAGLPLVVLLKEPEVETFSATHALRPRVILESPFHLKEVMPVLGKMVAKWKRNEHEDSITIERKVTK